MKMMMQGWSSVLLLVFLSQASADWESEPEWSFQVNMNEDTELICNDSMAMVITTDQITWVLPDKKELSGNVNTNKHQLKDLNGLTNGILVVKNVESSDHGLYFCMVNRDNKMYKKINRGLNLYGYKARDNFDLYRTNVITAFVAAIVFVVPLAVVCFLYHYRYKTEEEKRAIKAQDDYFKQLHEALKTGGEYPVKPSKKHGYHNKGYENTHL